MPEISHPPVAPAGVPLENAFRVLDEGGVTCGSAAVVEYINHALLPEHPAHRPFALLCERIRPALRDRVTVMHFNRDFRQQAQDAGFRCAYAQRA